MEKITAEAYVQAALELLAAAEEKPVAYVAGGMSLAGMDCQGLCEYLLMELGVSGSRCNLAGSNAHYRACLWTGSPEECAAVMGRIPAGAWLFIVEDDGGEPVQYRGDGAGNASHMGVYLGRGQGALHASASKGCVCRSTFEEKTIPGGWNRVGLPVWVEYSAPETDAPDHLAQDQTAGGVGDGLSAGWALVDTPDGNPVKLRDQPSRLCTLYHKVPCGGAVWVEKLVLKNGRTWAKVRWGNRQGYIMSEYLKRR
ncbi:MAG: NlpC/P60 family protein [Clostridiales bacterium]|nr:NlpC/P60 family protein [Clostridiales bacterium]